MEERTDSSEGAPSTGASIWIFEAGGEDRRSLERLLAEGSYEVTSFASPAELLGAFGADGPALDLLILGHDGPEHGGRVRTGVELLREVRATPRGAGVPILSVTAPHSQSSLLNAFEAGASDVLRRPFGASELVARVAWQLERDAHVRRLRQESRDMERLTELARALHDNDDLGALLDEIYEGVVEALHVDHVGVYLIDGASGRLVLAQPEETELDSAIGELDLRALPEVARCLAEGRPSHFDAESLGALFEAMGGDHPEPGPSASGAVFAMRHGEEPIGALVVYDAQRPGVGCSERERTIARFVCDLAAVAVHRAELYGTLREERAEIDRWSRELTRTRDLLQSVIHASPDAIVAADRSGEIVVFNPAAERILGWSRDEAIGMDVRALYPEGGAERLMERMRRSGSGGMGRNESERETVVDRQGRAIPVSISAAIIYRDGREAGTVGIFTDLRDKIRMENELQEANASLQRNRQQAMIAEISGAAAHELNQPLTSLLSYAELLAERIPPDPELERATSRVVRETRRVAEIVKKIGKVTRYETTDYVGSTRIVDLNRSSEVFDEEE